MARGEAAADIIRRETIHQDCGNDANVTLDPKQAWIVEHEHICYACATRDMVRRDLEKKHENDKPRPGKLSWQDGRLWGVRPAKAKDLEQAQAKRRAQDRQR